jgi:ABC-type transport system involved in multi-copper enzyme maturation permease subunit
MTKLEELTALLVNEINDFKKGVEKLEKINDHLKDTKIKIDVSEYKAIVEAHQKQMDIHKNMIEGFENRFNNKIKEAKIYPTWAVVVFIIFIVISVILVSYIFMK